MSTPLPVTPPCTHSLPANPVGVIRPRRTRATPRRCEVLDLLDDPVIESYAPRPWNSKMPPVYKTPRRGWNTVVVDEVESPSSDDDTTEHQFTNPGVKRRLVFD